jgi:hypothetical protein
MTYRLDTFHPDRLRCEQCGHALPVLLDDWDNPCSLRRPTEGEAASYCPELAADLALHGLVYAGSWFADQEMVELLAAPGSVSCRDAQAQCEGRPPLQLPEALRPGTLLTQGHSSAIPARR